PARRRNVSQNVRTRNVVTVSAQPALIESLETRTHLSVSKDAAGFTVVTPGSGTQVFYVSPNGSDSNSGTSASSPLKTIAKGVSKLRAGAGDQLLLQRGASFSGTFGLFSKSGASSSQPTVLGAYGAGARPVITSGSEQAFSIGNRGGVSNVIVQGLKMQPGSGTGNVNGVAIIGKASNITFEDCEITRYTNNVVLQKYFGDVSNITLRRDVITDAYSRGGNSEGLFAEGVTGLTLEENVFDHNGWGNGRAQTTFNHGAYVRASTSGLVARGNVFSNSSSHGLQARGGGVVENNVFIDNPTGMSFGLVNGSPVTPGGVGGRVTNNVFFGTKNIGGQTRGTAIEIGNVKRGGTTVSGNVIANGVSTTKLPAIQLTWGSGNDNASTAVGINDLTLSNNVVYNWSSALWVVAGQAPGSGQRALNNLKVTNNQFQNIATAGAIVPGATAGTYSGNLYTTQVYNKAAKNTGATNVKVSYADPTRTPGKAVGGTNATFVSLARQQGKANWKTNLLAASIVSYVKGGFTATGTTAVKR
ncbi:MAG: hypothetical protein JWO31_307, partial [Phycisphaerales bacterium]|nr:hypothetical protein [Phycisphaerales bacterium]